MVHDRPSTDVDPATLYRILQLRSAVFVVEQACAYLDLDGRDLEPGCRLLWVAGEGGEVLATARVLPDVDVDEDGGAGGAVTRIGRIATAGHARGRGLAGGLIRHAVATSPGPWVLGAQAHLAGWYATFGFAVDGPEYDEDGIPHLPLRRPR